MDSFSAMHPAHRPCCRQGLPLFPGLHDSNAFSVFPIVVNQEPTNYYPLYENQSAWTREETLADYNAPHATQKPWTRVEDLTDYPPPHGNQETQITDEELFGLVNLSPSLSPIIRAENQPPSVTVTGAPRERVSQACVNCQRSKTKCTGERSGCQPCSLKKLTCFYHDVVRPSRPRRKRQNTMTEVTCARAPRACMDCRESKKRCTGEESGCGRCSSKKLPCTYVQRRQRSRRRHNT